MATWFECKVRYEKVAENGMNKKVTEPYLVDALSFTEAEARIIEEMTPFISGEFTVSDVKRANFSELFPSNEDAADRWFKFKLYYITLDEKNGAEKRVATNILVQAADLRDSIVKMDEGMKGTMADYVIASVTETAIMDVYYYEAGPDAPKSEISDNEDEAEDEDSNLHEEPDHREPALVRARPQRDGPRCAPATKEQGGGHGRDGHHVDVLSQEEQGELHRAVFGVEATDELALSLWQVERCAVRFADHRRDVDEERWQQQQQEPQVGLALDDARGRHGSGVKEDANEGQAHSDLVRDHLRAGT